MKCLIPSNEMTSVNQVELCLAFPDIYFALRVVCFYGWINPKSLWTPKCYMVLVDLIFDVNCTENIVDMLFVLTDVVLGKSTLDRVSEICSGLTSVLFCYLSITEKLFCISLLILTVINTYTYY